MRTVGSIITIDLWGFEEVEDKGVRGRAATNDYRRAASRIDIGTSRDGGVDGRV
jgi:hypothetical protein